LKNTKCRQNGKYLSRKFQCSPAVPQAPVCPGPRGLQDVGHDRPQEGGKESHEHRVRRDLQEKIQWTGICKKRDCPDSEMRLPSHACSFILLFFRKIWVLSAGRNYSLEFSRRSVQESFKGCRKRDEIFQVWENPAIPETFRSRVSVHDGGCPRRGRKSPKSPIVG